MTDQELIVWQSKQIEELRDMVADLKERSRKAWMHIYCIGGPLNDNKLGYSKPQMVTFAKIARELSEGWMRGFEKEINMTTTVKISAHLASTKEVKVTINNGGTKQVEEFTLQDGEKTEICVYDGRSIIVQEVEK